jgi:hypothetical protein
MKLLALGSVFAAMFCAAHAADDVDTVSAVDLFTHTGDYVGKKVRVTGMWDAESSKFYPAAPAIKYTCLILADVATNKAASEKLRETVERIWLKHVGGREITLVCDFEGAFVRNPQQKVEGIFEYKLIVSRVYSFREPNQLPDPTSPSVTPPAGAGGAPSVAAAH